MFHSITYFILQIHLTDATRKGRDVEFYLGNDGGNEDRFGRCSTEPMGLRELGTKQRPNKQSPPSHRITCPPVHPQPVDTDSIGSLGILRRTPPKRLTIGSPVCRPDDSPISAVAAITLAEHLHAKKKARTYLPKDGRNHLPKTTPDVILNGLIGGRTSSVSTTSYSSIGSTGDRFK